MPEPNPHQPPAPDPRAVAQLAYLNWKHDGCPSGQDLTYWLEAESQLKASWHLVVENSRPMLPGESEPRPTRPPAR